MRAAGGNITISGAKIGGNITVLGGQAVITESSEISGSLVGGAGSLQILSPVARGATFGAGQATIVNSIGGDVLAATGQLSLSPNAKIAGNLTYISTEKADIQEGASVSGKVKQEMPPEALKKAGKDVAKAIGGFAFFLSLMDITSTLILGLLLIFFLPNYMNNAGTFIRKKFWQSFLIGLIGIIVIPVVAVLFMITLIGVPIGILIFVIYFIFLWLAKIFSIYAIGQAVFARTKNRGHVAWVFVIGLIAYIVLTLIPIINIFTYIIVLLTGAGAFLAMKREYYVALRTKKQI